MRLRVTSLRALKYYACMHNYVFPATYAPWLASRLPLSLKEHKATCQSCLMARPVATRPGATRDPGVFSESLKCCTYFPYIPNFSLGAFAENDFAKAASAGILLPVGLYPSVAYQERKAKAVRLSFGQQADLLCPFFNQNQNSCGIWSLRPGVCTSYFCQSDRGAEGLKLWSEIEDYLNQFEWTLAKRVFEDLGFSENELAFGRAAISLETEQDERQFFIEAAWGTHLGKENEFYKRARAMALSYTAQQLESILGSPLIESEEFIRQKITDFSA